MTLQQEYKQWQHNREKEVALFSYKEVVCPNCKNKTMIRINNHHSEYAPSGHCDTCGVFILEVNGKVKGTEV